MKNKYVCSICGSEHYDLGEYVDCVNKCNEKIKKDEAQKRLEEVNAMIHRIKSAKAAYELLLNEFKEKYPEEYKLNFAEDSEDCNNTRADLDDCDDWLAEFETNKKDESTEKRESIAITYKNDGKNKPELSASINGKKVSDDALNKLFEDPGTKYIAQLLRIL